MRLFKKVIAILVIALAAALAATAIYTIIAPTTTFLGQPILYRNTFKTGSQIIYTSPNSTIWTDCAKEESSIILTADTAIFKTKHGSLGLKPLHVGANNELICVTDKGATVVLMRIKPPGYRNTPKNQLLLLIEGDRALLLNPNNKCLTADDLK